MVQKRQLAEEEYDVSPKHLKLENSCQLVSSLEFPSKDVPLKPYTSGKAEECSSEQISGSYSFLESGKTHNLSVSPERNIGYAFFSLLSTSSWTSSTMSEEHSSLKPRTLVHPEDNCSYLLQSLPSKKVPIGPEYQASIPEWCKNGPNPASHRQNETKFMGSCVIPMPDDDSTVCDHNVAGKGRTNCPCENINSLECVQLHIREAREDLKGNIGNKRFLELGFSNMGDIVADHWTEGEEQLFHEVVYSNPASLGKNFWDHLAAAFPSRTNQEIVSYYFNVFVLQKRAEQNRSDPENADSDDDEWQGSDSSDDEDEIQKHGFSIKTQVFDYYKDTGFLHGFSENSNFSSLDSDQTPVGECGGDHDFQDDSCTSSDTGIEPLSNEVNHEFIFEPSDLKVWDVGCFSFPRSKTDFLPTGSMIEEVFGVESWNLKITDKDKGSC